MSQFSLLAACTDQAQDRFCYWLCLNAISDAFLVPVHNRGICQDCRMVVRVEGYPQSAVALRKGEGNREVPEEAPTHQDL